jgi:carboxyl-terminal processing protease
MEDIMDYYNGDINQPQSAQPAPPQPPKKKNKPGFAPGFFLGALVGIVVVGLALFVGVHIYTSATGGYLVLDSKSVHKVESGNVLDQDTIDKIEELLAYVDVYYNDEYDKDELRDAIYKGTLDGLDDPYSIYYTADEYKDLQVSTQGNYYGIGAGLTQDSKTMEVTVSKVYEGTPAEEAGLLSGDQILKVDDITATSMELSALVKQIRGEEGTTVHLSVYRESTDETLELDVERRNVDLPSVESKMLDDGIGYIQITEFQSNTAAQFKEALTQLQEDGMTSMIVDVRSNPGGLLTSVVEILDTILPEGTVVYTEDKYGKREDYTSDAQCLQCPIAVLVDGNSASAAEIFAGAIKDYDYGTLIGTTTFGKGIVQTIYPLNDGSAIKLTTAKYYTPNGNYIHGVGIDPDIELEYQYSGAEDEPYDMQYDNQLQRAIKELKK